MKLYTRNELKNGRIFFDKQPPRYMTLFIILLVVFLIVSVIGAHFVKRPYVVKAQGTVSIDGKSYLSTKTQGVVTEIKAEAGDFVEAGEIILKLSSGNEGLQQSVAEAQILELEDTLNAMNKYEKALKKKENTLSQTGKELEYYGKVAYYLDMLDQETFEVNKTNSDISERKTEKEELMNRIKQLKEKINDINEQISTNKETDKNLKQKLRESDKKQQTLIAEITELEEKLNQNEDVEKITKALSDKQQELDKLMNSDKNLNDSSINSDELIEEQIELKSELEMKESKVEGLDEEIKQLSEQTTSPYSQAEQTRLQLLSELGEKRNQIQNQLTELRATEEVAAEQDTVHIVTATKSGIIHYLQPLSVGMSVQQNQVLGEIATDSEGMYVDTYIQAQDRSRVKIGQSVNVAIVGINNYRFGTIDGIVESIEPGTVQNETNEGVVSLYRAKVHLNEEFLSNKGGEVIELVRSMPVEARVVYQEESYLEWLLNLLNLKSS